MPPEATATPDASLPVSELSSSAVEVPAPEPAPSTPEPAPAPAEAVPATETAPASAEATAGTQPTTQTAKIPPNELIESEPDPIQPPSSAAPVQISILHTAPSVAKAMEGTRDLLNKARVSIQDRKRKKRDKIMTALNSKNKITNDEVEKLLHVSDATATRYLSALEKEGRIRQVDKTGQGVVYSKI